MDLKACLSLENKESGQNVGPRKQKIMCLHDQEEMTVFAST